MQSQYRLHKARKLLEAADQAFEGDETSPEGAQLMWEATVAALSDVAKNRGWPYETTDDLKQAASRLDERKEGYESSIMPYPHFTLFGLAGMFLEQAEWDFECEWPQFRWDKYDYQDGRKALKKYLSTVEKLAQRDPAIR